MNNEKRNKKRSGRISHHKNSSIISKNTHPTRLHGQARINGQARLRRQVSQPGASSAGTDKTKKEYLPDTKNVVDKNDDFSLKYLNSNTKNTTKRKIDTRPHRQAQKNTPKQKINPQREKKSYTAGFNNNFFETSFEQTQKNKNFTTESSVPPIKEGVLRIVPLGGVEEIGKNMTVIEYGDEIIIVDCGFQFSEAETPGIDFLLPDVSYLEKMKKKIKAIFITHGHYDHIGAIPYIVDKIGNPPIYSRQFGAYTIEKRQTEFPELPKLNMNIIEENETIAIGKHFRINFFAISHAIPDSMGLIIETPVGKIAFIEDVRLEHINGVPTEKEVERYARFKNEEMLLLTMDSTSVEKPGFSIPESRVIETINEIMKNVPGRLIIGTFASQVERIMEFIKMSQHYNKKVVIDGRSMKTNIEIVRLLNLVKLENIIPIEEMKNYPANKIVIIATGAQGEEYSVFDRIANKSHKYIKLEPSDTVLFSASAIPGNERSITRLKDNLYRQNAKIITYADSDVHASGHGNRGELEWIHKQIPHRFFIPLHGYHFMLRIHAELAESLGLPKSNIVIPDNGSVIEITEHGKKIEVRKEKAPSDPVMVDGFSIGNMQDVVIRDRQLLAEDGIFIIIATINARTGKLRKSPDIISRGFVYLRESQELLQQTRLIIKKVVEESTTNMYPINFDYIKTNITDSVRKFLLQQTAKKPLVIPVVLAI
ncbi:RNase J family beta-CASP ribonuclease [Patescibacteria group bacterium]|nr:RNase J family beta-CASP ribonuclease [Patescibacteria group bacterium]MBU4116031.1 RNase J family beta-CASP ribonuclease [Patescibacteria group bacterium]